MKRFISILLAAVVLCASLFGAALSASAEEPEQEVATDYNHYCHYPIYLGMIGMPRYIKCSFDYDTDYIDIYPAYPGYGDDGYVFPLATERYGNMYDLDYTVDGTFITFEYTLKKGYTLDDYLDVMDKNNSAAGLTPVSREPDEYQSFPLFDVAMKYKEFTFGQIVDGRVIDVISTENIPLYKDGERVGKGGAQGYLVPLLNLDAPPAPTEGERFSGEHLSELLSQYAINKPLLREYDEIYDHKDENGETDWVLVSARADSSDYTGEAYHEFGNRVMDRKYGYVPFAFGMGVYIVKHGRFFDVDAPELYELADIERVWTELGAGRLMGDMDNDNELTVTDATLIQRCQAEMMDYPEDDVNTPSGWFVNSITYFSDFDQDGERSIADATAIQRYLADLKYRPADWIPYPHIVVEEPDPSIPRIISSKSTGFGIELKLSTVPGAEKYRIYRRGENWQWTKIGETIGDTFVDTDVAVNTDYTYTVRCVKADNSAFTSDFDREGWRIRYYPQLDTPKITRIEAASNGAKITWRPVEGANLYRVYYKHNGSWTKIADTNETSCVHTGIIPSQTLTYTVRCLSLGGKAFASDYNRDGVSFHLEATPVLEDMEVHLDGVSFIVRGDHNPGDVAVYRKEGSGWKRIGTVPPLTRFTDTDVQPGKTYTYTCRCLSWDGSYFTSFFDSKGWSQKFTVDQCIPELDYVLYDESDNSVLVRMKENKFGIEKFGIDVFFINDYLGTFIIGTEPCYLSADFWKETEDYHFYIFGLDKNENVITSYAEDGAYIYMFGSPTNLKAQKTGDRTYRFSWSRGKDNGKYNLNLYTADGELIVDSEVIGTTYYDIDLSGYPEDQEYVCLVIAAWEDNPSISAPISMDFKEADYQ